MLQPSRRRFLEATILFAALGSRITAARADTLDSIKSKGVLTVGAGVLGVKPWLYQNDDGSLTGMEFDMATAVTAKLGIPRLEYVHTEWDSLIPGLLAKRWDVIFSGMTITEERRQGSGIEFSRPYFFETLRITVTADSPYKDLPDLKGKTLGAALGGTDAIVAQKLKEDGAVADTRFFNDFTAPFMALRNGQVDAIVADNVVIGEQQALGPVRVIGPTFGGPAKPEWQAKQDAAPYKFGAIGVAVRKEDTALLAAINKALDETDADGTRRKIYEKYSLWDASLEAAAMVK